MAMEEKSVDFQYNGYVVLKLADGDDDLLKRAQEVRYKVFVEQRGWAPPSSCRLDVDSYDGLAHHFCVCSSVADVLGTVRISRGGESSYMLDKEFFQLVEDDPSIVLHDAGHAEITRLTVAPDISPSDKTDIALCLYRIMYMWSKIHDVRYWYAVVEPRYVRILQRMGFPFEPIGPKKSLDGNGLSVAVSLDLRDAETMLAERAPDRLRWFQALLPP